MRAIDMSSGEMLVFGKAMIWWGLPLALAGWELWRLKREKRNDRAAAARTGKDGAR